MGITHGLFRFGISSISKVQKIPHLIARSIRPRDGEDADRTAKNVGGFGILGFQLKDLFFPLGGRGIKGQIGPTYGFAIGSFKDGANDRVFGMFLIDDCLQNFLTGWASTAKIVTKSRCCVCDAAAVVA